MLLHLWPPTITYLMIILFIIWICVHAGPLTLLAFQMAATIGFTLLVLYWTALSSGRLAVSWPPRLIVHHIYAGRKPSDILPLLAYSIFIMWQLIWPSFTCLLYWPFEWPPGLQNVLTCGPCLYYHFGTFQPTILHYTLWVVCSIVEFIYYLFLHCIALYLL